VPEIAARFEDNTLWVAGPHVSTYYLGDEAANTLHKRRDAEGRIWHNMGDHIIVSESGWWYAGRSSQMYEDFLLEQKIYAFLKCSDSFVSRTGGGKPTLFGNRVHAHKAALQREFPQLSDVCDLTVYRDKRHRARIDRQTSLKKGAPWTAG
jgi:olefin beta-lactone synthetase